MTNDHLRKALGELNAERDLQIAFTHVLGATVPPLPSPGLLNIKRAMLIPDEEDHLVKVTDGTHVYVIEARHVAWMKIG